MSAIVTVKKDEITPDLKAKAQGLPGMIQDSLVDVGSYWRKRLVREIGAGEGLAAWNKLTVDLYSGFRTDINRQRRLLREKANPRSKVNPYVQEKLDILLQKKRDRSKMGGKLPGLIRFDVGKGNVRIGWLENKTPGVVKRSSMFQRSQQRAFSRGEREVFRILLGNAYKQPGALNRPERPAIANYDKYLASESRRVFNNSFAAKLAWAQKKGIL